MLTNDKNDWMDHLLWQTHAMATENIACSQWPFCYDCNIIVNFALF